MQHGWISEILKCASLFPVDMLFRKFRKACTVGIRGFDKSMDKADEYEEEKKEEVVATSNKGKGRWTSFVRKK
jgi:hypothetical protein